MKLFQTFVEKLLLNLYNSLIQQDPINPYLTTYLLQLNQTKQLLLLDILDPEKVLYQNYYFNIMSPVEEEFYWMIVQLET